MGRATPDVSALGEGYQVFVGGKAETVGGTSASSPAFASVVSLLNGARLNADNRQEAHGLPQSLPLQERRRLH
jgi:tripeptidyl-peptidase-1